MTRIDRSSVLLALSITVSCVSTPRSARSPLSDASAITAAQLEQRQYQNLLQAVQALRSNWLSTRGTDSFNTPSQVVVYVDDTRFGGVEALSSLPIQGVASVTHLNGIDATARWGIGHSAGVIAVHTWPSGSRTSGVSEPAAKDSSTGKSP
jgi:hypothetical protein